MKLLKQITSILAALAICSTLVPVTLASTPTIVLNETYDSYATNNDTIKNVSMRGGVDNRVVDGGYSGKCFYSKLWGTSLMYDATATIKANSAVIGGRFKIEGEPTTGTLLAVTDGSGSVHEFVKLNKGAITSYDGKRIAGIKQGEWFKLDVVINSAKNYIDIYYNGGLALEHWYISSKVASIATVQIKMLAPEDTNTFAELYVDNLRAYIASEPAKDSVFPTVPLSTKSMSFEPTTDLSDVLGWVITDERFFSAGNVGIANDGNTVKIDTEENGNTYLLMQRKDQLTNAYIDFSVTDADIQKLLVARAYTVCADIRYDKLSGPIDVLDIRREDASWYTTGRLDTTGALNVRGKAAGIIGAKAWHKVSYVFNNTTSRMSVYVDGKLTATDLSFDPNTPPQRFRYGMELTGDTDNTLGIDNFRIYEGDDVNKSFEEAEAPVVAAETSDGFLGEHDIDAISLFSAGDVALVPTVGSVFRNGAKEYPANAPYASKNAPVRNEATTDYDGSDMMLPLSFIKDTWGTEFTVSGDTITSGNTVFTVGSTTYTVAGTEATCALAPEAYGDEYALPLEAVVKDVLNKNLYVEPRGIAFITNNKFTYRDSDGVDNVYDKIDVIARYLYFKRPSAEQVKADLEANIGSAHPRLLGTQADFDALKVKVENNSRMRTWADSVIASADALGEVDPPVYERLTNNDAPHILPLSRGMMNNMSNLTIAYELTGDTKYADIAYKYLINACNYPDWCADTHYLSCAEMMYGIGIGYDTFYNVFTPEQRTAIRDGFVKNGFDPSYGCYTGQHGNNYWVNGDDNFTSVCPGGIMASCIAFYDDPVIGEKATELIPQTLKSFEYVMTLLYPDGAWYESATYFTYVMQYMCAAFNALFNVTGGNDYDLFKFPGVKNVGKFIIGVQGNVDGAFNFHDGSKGFQTYPEYLWFAHVVGDTEFAQAMTKMGLRYGFSETSRLLMFYDEADNVSNVEYPLDVFMREANVGTMRQNWSVTGIWAGTHAGKTGIDHDALDIGEFIFESDGLRWIFDNGADNYSLPGYFSKKGYNIYRKRPESNNTIMINPRDGYTGQSTSSTNPLTRYESKDRGGIMVYDMSEAYREDALKAVRGFMLTNDRRTFIVRDELELDGQNEVYWFANIYGNPRVEGNKVISTVDGKEIEIEFASNAKLNISIVPEAPLPTSPIVEGQADDSSMNKIQVIAKGTGDINITAVITPGSYKYYDHPSAKSIGEIDSWEIPDGTIPSQPKLTSISVDGVPVENFDSENTTTVINHALDDPTVPQISATAEDGASIEITQASSTTDKAVIKVTTPDGGINYYLVSFHLTVSLKPVEGYSEIPIASSKASEETQAENPISAATDNNIETAYANGTKGGFFEVDLGSVQNFDGIEMAFRFGSERYAYFEIQVSNDGVNYTNIGESFESSGNTDNVEVYSIQGTGRYVRFVNLGNSQKSPWLSLSEFHPVKKN